MAVPSPSRLSCASAPASRRLLRNSARWQSQVWTTTRWDNLDRAQSVLVEPRWRPEAGGCSRSFATYERGMASIDEPLAGGIRSAAAPSATTVGEHGSLSTPLCMRQRRGSAYCSGSISLGCSPPPPRSARACPRLDSLSALDVASPHGRLSQQSIACNTFCPQPDGTATQAHRSATRPLRSPTQTTHTSCTLAPSFVVTHLF